jgi:hypothetical protein
MMKKTFLYILSTRALMDCQNDDTDFSDYINGTASTAVQLLQQPTHIVRCSQSLSYPVPSFKISFSPHHRHREELETAVPRPRIEQNIFD